MLVRTTRGNEDIALVYVGEKEGKRFEFAESVQPPYSRMEKWVLIISCLYGCPVQCLMCDAGTEYKGCMSKEDILAQIDYIVRKRFPDGNVPVKKFKVQFTRMGEPAFNYAVLDVLEELPSRYNAPGLIPSLSTIGPKNCGVFFQRLLTIKELYRDFQLQYSIHTTDTGKRDALIPVPKMSFGEIAAYGKSFSTAGKRKITLNFIVMQGYPIEPSVISRVFNPDYFLIKLTPLNPTRKAEENNLTGNLLSENSISPLVDEFQKYGFEVIVSIGEQEENTIGSNCGQYAFKG